MFIYIKSKTLDGLGVRLIESRVSEISGCGSIYIPPPCRSTFKSTEAFLTSDLSQIVRDGLSGVELFIAIHNLTSSMSIELEDRRGSPSVVEDEEPLLPTTERGSDRKVEIGSWPLVCLLLQHLSR